ncbi:hypothetical protein M378DRAFT_67457 [Amanita muscaria Koide BX008]|uniref:Epoxide hydrolase N-terminal domain-containing protein n=1 Tax=Amanita muscaria (strain Koide BX008) TaxID=946122 RepID=A0A0C2TTC0_AMAMK|nr:hypothetical protein M378DRAFT_67457 [Amanita muscaria Koide BX008]
MTSGREKPFRIEIPDEKLELLRKKLELTVLPDELEDVGRDYGVPLADIKRLLARWKDGYDWRKYEAQLNDDLPQYTQELDVDGFGVFTVHYVHQKSTVTKAIPLLFVHGWPGSFIEVRKILPLLTQASPEHPSFHVVAVSLPGYAFSSAPTKKGFNLGQYAELFNKLMISLGYNEYVTQGGDWGSAITRQIALLYGGKHSKALHTNLPLEINLSLKARLLAMISQALWGTPADEKARTERRDLFTSKGSGYMAIQSTQPQTLGYGFADSPVGLLAWIYEKLVNWTDDYKWDDDEVLTWVSIYWFSHTGPAASVRIYYEVLSTRYKQQENTRIPLGYSYFPEENPLVPLIKPLKPSNLVFESQHHKGGHFPATEVPELLVSDLRKMFGKGGPAAGVVAGHSGYD